MGSIAPLYEAIGAYSATVTQTASTITVPVTAARAVLCVTTAAIRETQDGTTPVGATGAPAVGILRAANEVWEIYGYANLLAMKVVRDAATDARLSVQFYKALV